MCTRWPPRGASIFPSKREPATVRGDREALRTLVRNLVDNAVRHTPEGGSVRVRTRRGLARCRGAASRRSLEVADSGPGMPPADRERAFDRFYRRAGSPRGRQRSRPRHRQGDRRSARRAEVRARRRARGRIAGHASLSRPRLKVRLRRAGQHGANPVPRPICRKENCR